MSQNFLIFLRFGLIVLMLIFIFAYWRWQLRIEEERKKLRLATTQPARIIARLGVIEEPLIAHPINLFDDPLSRHLFFYKAPFQDNVMLFESVRVAREVANLSQSYTFWDGCNAIEIVEEDLISAKAAIAIEKAIALCNAQCCRIGEFCSIDNSR
jgi:hypothetical protein